MENPQIREQYNHIIKKIKISLHTEKQCIAAYLLGSASHDLLWEWSDLQIAVILEDGYRGKPYYSLYEEDLIVALNLYSLTAFKEFIGAFCADDYLWKAFAKSTKLFSKDPMLDEWMEDAFYVGEVDHQKEVLLGFSGAVYYLNKAEKNFYIKENLENTIYFIPQIAENIAWIEIFKHREIPQRELIPQGKRLSPTVFEKIYDPLFSLKPGENANFSKESLQNILEQTVSYLKENTSFVYQPILAYLEKHGNSEGFRYETCPHGFGINYEWLVRCGIACRYGIPEKIPFFKQGEKLGYYLRSNISSINP